MSWIGLKSIRTGSQHVLRTLAAQLAVWKRLIVLKCANRGAPDVSQYEAPHPLLACALSGVQDRGMTSHSAPEPYRAPPAGRVGEHQIDAASPGRELGEFRRPGR